MLQMQSSLLLFQQSTELLQMRRLKLHLRQIYLSCKNNDNNQSEELKSGDVNVVEYLRFFHAYTFC